LNPITGAIIVITHTSREELSLTTLTTGTVLEEEEEEEEEWVQEEKETPQWEDRFTSSWRSVSSRPSSSDARYCCCTQHEEGSMGFRGWQQDIECLHYIYIYGIWQTLLSDASYDKYIC